LLKLVAKNIGAVVVADDQGSVTGILSERDIVRAVAKRGTAVFDDGVSMHMTAEVITTSEDERVYVAMEKMTNGRFRHLPVICHERLVGLVSIGACAQGGRDAGSLVCDFLIKD
jgi:CBS domain-containing protein